MLNSLRYCAGTCGIRKVFGNFSDYKYKKGEGKSKYRDCASVLHGERKNNHCLIKKAALHAEIDNLRILTNEADLHLKEQAH